MTKITITLEIETRPYSPEEAAEEAALCGMEGDDFIDDEVDAQGIGECFADYLSECPEEALAGSNLFTKIGGVRLVSAAEVLS
jgi:hypothetical protein